MRSALVMLLLLVVLFPARAQEAASTTPPKHSHVAIEAHADACMGLSDSECCTQSLELAGFRATGDQLVKSAKNPVRMSCASESKVLPDTACRAIAMARGFGAKAVESFCAPHKLDQRCTEDAECKSCVHALERLEFKGAPGACYAVTRVTTNTKDDSPKVIVVREGKQDAAGNGVEIRKRRTVVQ